MPSGVYERKPKNPDAPRPKRGRPRKMNGTAALLAQLRAEREKAVDLATALGTAIDALEAL